MDKIFGFSRNGLALVGILVALFLVVAVGLIIMGSAAIRALAAPGVKVEGISLLALLLTIIVLLTAVFIMLLVLFFCCCKKQKTGREAALPPNLVAALLPLLPLLPDIRNIMRDVAVALYASGKTLGWVNWRVISAADYVKRVAGDAERAAHIKVKVNVPFVGWTDDHEINPLEPIVGNLKDAAVRLDPTLASGLGIPPIDIPLYPLTLDSNDVDMGTVALRMQDAGKALAAMAKRLGAANVPTELTP